VIKAIYNMPSLFKKLKLEGLILIEPGVFPDNRGFFMETYKKSEYARNGIDMDFVQDNQSYSTKGVVRGMHYQRPPHAQGKLVRVVSGRVLDVVVDMRASSPSFGEWEGVELSGENKRMLWISPGFAHGFACLSEDAVLLYKCTAEYDKASEAGFRYDDPEVGVKWPFMDAAVSDKDAALPPFSGVNREYVLPNGRIVFPDFLKK